MVRPVVGLPHPGEGRAVELEQAVDRVQPEPPAVVVVLGEARSDDWGGRDLAHLVISTDEPGVLVDEVRML